MGIISIRIEHAIEIGKRKDKHTVRRDGGVECPSLLRRIRRTEVNSRFTDNKRVETVEQMASYALNRVDVGKRFHPSPKTEQMKVFDEEIQL